MVRLSKRREVFQPIGMHVLFDVAHRVVNRFMGEMGIRNSCKRQAGRYRPRYRVQRGLWTSAEERTCETCNRFGNHAPIMLQKSHDNRLAAYAYARDAFSPLARHSYWQQCRRVGFVNLDFTARLLKERILECQRKTSSMKPRGLSRHTERSSNFARTDAILGVHQHQNAGNQRSRPIGESSNTV